MTAFLYRERLKEGPWRALRWAIVFFLALATIVVLAAVLLGDIASALQLGPLTAVTAVVVFGFPTLLGRLQAWRMARSDPNVNHPIRHTFAQSGLTVEMRTLTAELRWSGMYAVRETPTMFLFYYSKRLAYYLPKRVLGSSGSTIDLGSWISRHLPETIPFFPQRSGV